MSDIKSMKLYTHVERIDNELAQLGKRNGDGWTIFIALSSKTSSRVSWAGYAFVPNW